MAFDESVFSACMRPLTGSAIRDIFNLIGKPGMISFAGGNPAESALEPDVVSTIAARQLRTYGTKLLQYGATEGFAPLRESVTEFVKTCGIETSPARVLPTQGSQQALDLLTKALVDPGDTVLVEAPTFLGALQTFHTYGANVVSMPSDDEGVIPDQIEALIKEHKPKLIYIIPTFQNPTGHTLTLARRKDVARIAGQYGVIIAEDDPYRDLRYAGEPLPSIKSFDESGFVIYLGSFSKLISPGLRVGYAIVDEPTLLRKMTIGKQSVDVHSPLLNQAIVDGYLREGLLMPHIVRICDSYRAQLNRMLEALAGFPDGVRCTKPEGGLFVWVALPEHLSATALFKEALARNVAYVPGTHFFEGGGHENTLRLNFSNSELPAIERGMTLLGALIAEKMK